MQQIERTTNRAWLGEFLRSRRERLLPSDFGFPIVRRRRSRGLRRDEVAQLAGISIAYYTWIEQGRDINISAEVINAVARALKLSEAERVHLFALVGIVVAGSDVVEDQIHPTLARFFESESSNWCALVYDDCFNVLQATELAVAIFDIAPQCSIESNLLYRLFAEPAQRAIWIDWESEARLRVGMFRHGLARRPDSADGFRLLEILLRMPEFARVWTEYDVRVSPSPDEFFRSEPWQLVHPTIGSLRVHRLAMDLPASAYRRLAMFSAADIETACKFRQMLERSHARGERHLRPA